MNRRQILASMAALAGTTSAAQGAELSGEMPWEPGQANVPPLSDLGPDRWAFFTPAEAEAVGAIADRIVPADELSVGGKEAGCARFIDRELAGPYGRAATQYRLGRFVKGTAEQGIQSPLAPADRYRLGLAALDRHCRAAHGKGYANLPPAEQDKILSAMEAGTLDLGEVDAKEMFEQVLQNVREGFLADPLYGGNKDLVSWRMLGFPGAQYDFRDVIDLKGKKLDFVPVSMIDKSL